jgi:hypothetical protein
MAGPWDRHSRESGCGPWNMSGLVLRHRKKSAGDNFFFVSLSHDSISEFGAVKRRRRRACYCGVVLMGVEFAWPEKVPNNNSSCTPHSRYAGA